MSTVTITEEQLDTVKAKQQATWASGDYSVIGTSLQITGEQLVETLAIEAGWRVLDVAAGNGNAALAAARRSAVVTATDYVPALLERAAARADAEGLELETRVGDSEELPFPDGSFDAVISVFGVMFSPRQERAASELLRVARHGGRIGLANWTPDSFVAAMFGTVARHVPAAPIPSVFRWGVEADVVGLLRHGLATYSAQERQFLFRYPSAEAFVETFRTYYGPTHKAFAALDTQGQAELEHDLIDLAREWGQRGVQTLVVPSSYLEFTAVVA